MTKDQVEKFIRHAELEAGPECGDQWFSECAETLRRASALDILFSKHPRPWRVSEDRAVECGHGLRSAAILDATGQPAVILDPSEGEYAPAVDPDTAAQLVEFVNGSR